MVHIDLMFGNWWEKWIAFICFSSARSFNRLLCSFRMNFWNMKWLNAVELVGWWKNVAVVWMRWLLSKTRNATCEYSWYVYIYTHRRRCLYMLRVYEYTAAFILVTHDSVLLVANNFCLLSFASFLSHQNSLDLNLPTNERDTLRNMCSLKFITHLICFGVICSKERAGSWR